MNASFKDCGSGFNSRTSLLIFAGWSKKWNDLVTKGPEYGSLKSSWLNVMSEADQLAEIHNELQIRLVNQVHGNLQKWKSANYHKSLLSWKETKTAEEGFSKAQKPWAKRHDEGTTVQSGYKVRTIVHFDSKIDSLSGRQIGHHWRNLAKCLGVSRL